MAEPRQPEPTVDEAPAPDALEAGLAAAFGPDTGPPLPPFASALRALGARLPAVPHVRLLDPEGRPVPPVSPDAPSEIPASPEGSGEFGRYEVSGEIARGGMGVILKGRDADLGRDIAVKVLLETHQGRTELLQRFVEEAQIGGQLQHPGIVPVYELGVFPDQRPYFTMKLVKGRTLADLLAERKDPSQDRPRFLKVFEQVCQTLAYAHARGVIHRDLKPSNVMVGSFGEVQVMDWGLAKVVDRGSRPGETKEEPQAGETEVRTARSQGPGVATGRAPLVAPQTLAGSILGTPAYMPPEQAHGEVDRLDRRCDVFGLGAMLCEILTGRPPYEGDHLQVLCQAASGEVGQAFARLDACGADGELIGLAKRCLAPEPAARPRDAAAVAEELTAYLQSVEARLRQAELAGVEARAKAAEERKRRRLTAALAATVVLALALGGGGWLWIKAERDGREARMSQEINDALTAATALRERARAAGGWDPTLAARAREQIQRARALLDNGPADPALAAKVQRLQVELEEEEKERQLLAALDEAWLAQTEATGGRVGFAFERAVPKIRAALHAYGMPVGEVDPGAVAERIRQRPPAVQEALVTALDDWLIVEVNRPLHERELEWLEAVVAAIETEGWGQKVRVALREVNRERRRAALERVAAADLEHLSPRTLVRLGWALQSVGAGDRALRLYRQALLRHPGDFWLNHELGVLLRVQSPPDLPGAVRYLTAAAAVRPNSCGAHFSLGKALVDDNKLAEAAEEFRQAATLDQQFALARHNLGVVLARQDKADEAIGELRRAADMDPEYGLTHLNLGKALLYDKHDVDQAVVEFRRALALEGKDAELDHHLAHLHHSLGVALVEQRELDKAIVEFRQALALNEKERRKPDRDVFGFRRDRTFDPKATLLSLGLALERQDKLDEAVAVYRQASTLTPDDATGHAHTRLGTALFKQGKLTEAVSALRRATTIDPKDAEAYQNLGVALVKQRHMPEAIAAFRRALEIDQNRASARVCLGSALAETGSLDEAATQFRRALEIDPQLADARHSLRHLAEMYNDLGMSLVSKQKLDEAIGNFRKALELNPRYAHAHGNLGTSLMLQGLVEEAIPELRKAVELEPKLAQSHCSLGMALLRRGHFAEARACLRRCLDQIPKGDPLRAVASQQLQECDRWLQLEQKLPGVLAKKVVPTNNAERLEYAMLCGLKRLYAGAAGLYEDAFAADPKVAEDLESTHRYSAACCAALAAGNQGADGRKPDEKERARWRKRAREWLRADLAARAKQLENGTPADREDVQTNLRHWLQDKDLASIRDKDAVAKLPIEEREACQKLWADVAELLQRTQGKPR
jgi:serine/threonine-protein kinase